MKKLMMAAAIVCAVCSLKAASVSWTAYQFESATGDIYDYGYFVDKDGNPYTSNPAGIDIVLCLMDGDTVKQVLDIGLNDGSGAVGGTFSFDYSSNTLKNGDVLKVFAKDADGKYLDLQASANPAGMDATVFNTLTVAGLSDDMWTNDEFIYATGNFTAAPEPTSGLLMLLGMAGLALRRRRA